MIQGDRAKWLFAKSGMCERDDCHPQRPLRMILLGAPGAGKGTQADKILKTFQTCPLSTGDVFRAAKQECDADALSESMLEALEAMRAGMLVSDETVNKMVEERVACLNCGYGFMLDGYPRTVPQAEALIALLEQLGIDLDVVLNFTIGEDAAIERLGGRRTCRACQKTCHVKFNPPKQEGVCDHCGGELFQRDDDKPASIVTRLEAYRSATAPLEQYFMRHGTLCNINAENDPDTVFRETAKVIRSILDSEKLVEYGTD